MIFIDSNIPMYLVGADHPHKIDARRLLEKYISVGDRLVSDAEVLQEILHRYTAIDRRDAIQPAFEVVLNIADAIYPIELEDIEKAKDILFGYPSISARDAIHIAIMVRHGITAVLTFDKGFSQYPGVVIFGG